MSSAADRMFEKRLQETAKLDFGPTELPNLDWNAPEMRQRLWLLQVATHMVGQSKQELGELLDSLTEDGTPTGLQELSSGLIEAGDFFKELGKFCDAALARMVVAGAARAVEPAR